MSGQKYEAKSLTSAELIAHSNGAEARSLKAAMAAKALFSMGQVMDSLDQIIPLLEQFDKERQRLGEYDASAAAIMQIAQVNLKVAQLLRAWLQAHADLVMENL